MSATARSTPGVIRVVSPANGRLLAELPEAGRTEVSAAVDSARRAAPAWGAAPLASRSEALKRWRDCVLDDRELVEVLVAESGKPRHEVEGIEILYFCELIRFSTAVARRALADETRHPLLFLTKKTRIVRKPLGVVGVIGPWNFPILNNAADAVAPLLAGNTVVLKPSDVTPLTSLRMRELWLKAGNPPDVFQVVVGRGAAGEALVSLADGVMFTGSVVTGRKVAARAGERLIPCVAELGGKSPLIVLEGADLEKAARAATWSGFVHSGQACIRTERVYVEEAVAERFEGLLTTRVRDLRQAVPDGRGELEHDTGALTFPRQLEVVVRHLENALAKGARLAAGGKARADLGPQYFEPTLLLGATQDMDVMREETFGPLLPVMRVKDAAEAIRLANDSHLGLNATIFGPEARARSLARQLESGNAIVNDVLVNYFVVEAPLGGAKASGIGARHGVEGIRHWTQAEAITVSRRLLSPVGGLIAKRLAFPYRTGVLGLVRRATRLLYGRGLRRKFGPLP